MRRALNSAYSEIPPDLSEVFEAARDQVADQQEKVSEALTRFISTQDLTEAEQLITAAIGEAQRSALRAARAYADDQSTKAQAIYAELVNIPTNVTDLTDVKQDLNQKFGRAVQLHEQNKVSALEPLLEVAREYKTWSFEARSRIVGSHGIVTSTKRQARLQVIAITVALVLGVLNLIFIIVSIFVRK